MGYIRTLGALPAGLAAMRPTLDTSMVELGPAGPKIVAPNLVVREGGVAKTLTPAQAIAAGYVYKDGRWQRKESAGPQATVTTTKSNRTICIEAGIPSGVEAELCATALASGKKIEDLVKEYKKRKQKGAESREHRPEVLLAGYRQECLEAGVPESLVEACAQARLQGTSLEEAAAGAIQAATRAAKKKSTTLLILLGAGGLAGLWYWQKQKRGKKRGKKGGK